MVNLNTIIQHLYPAAEPLRDYVVRDDSDGKGQYIAEWNLPEPQPTVEELAAASMAAVLQSERDRNRGKINTWRDEQERGSIVFEHASRSWDGGLAVRQRIKPLLNLPELPEGFFWTDANDIDVPTTLAELQALDNAHEAAIVQRGWDIHTRQRQMKQEIESLDADALAKYTVGWPPLELP